MFKSAGRTVILVVPVLLLLGFAWKAWGQTLQLSPSDILKRGNATPPSAIQIDNPGTPETNVEEPPAAKVPASLPIPTEAPEPGGPVAQGYLYIEPYQARFEALFDMTTMLEWLSPADAKAESLTPAIQKALIEKASPLVGNWCRMNAQNEKVEGRFLGVSVIKGVPGKTEALQPNESIPRTQAMLGLMWEFPIPPPPESIQIEWSGFVQDITTLNIRTFFGMLSEPMKVTSARPKVTWQNLNRLARPTGLAAVPMIDSPPPFHVPIAAIVWFLGGLIFYISIRIKDYRLPGGSVPYFVTWILGAVLMLPLLVVRVPRPGAGSAPAISTNSDAERILSPLLRNVYRAFDHRSESDIYDILSRSVDGELLRKLYLETITALTLDGREGTRVTVTEFTASVTDVERKDEGFVATCQWVALGNVGHWGHIHQRINRYTAKVTVQPLQSNWKITQLDVQEAWRS